MIAHLEFLEATGSRLRRWLIAGVVMFSLHAAGGTLALTQWPDDETSDESHGAFMLELAPVAAAPQTENLNLAIGPRAEELAALSASAPSEEVTEKSEVDTPEVDESPLAPTPEVVVQKKTEVVERPEEKQEQEDPRPKQEAMLQEAATPQEAKAPPPVEAPTATKAVAPKQGISSKPSEATISWQKAVALHLNKHKRYPAEAHESKVEGIVTVWFSIDRSGKMVAARLEKSCGSTVLDEEAIEMLKRASPFPRPPSDVTDVKINFTIPVRFQMKN